MISGQRLIPAILVALAAVPGALWAHSFDIAVVAPYSGPLVQVGERLWQGMRVATREADGHANETSDGHLGGVDSNLLRVDSDGGARRLAQRLRELGARQGVVIAVLGPEQPGLVGVFPRGVPRIVVLTGPAEGATSPDVFLPEVVEGEVQARFTARYRQHYGEPPDDAAAGGYAAARLIAAAMDALDGDLSDPAEVRQSFARAMRKMAEVR